MLARLVQDGFSRVDEKFDKIDERFERVDKKFEKIDAHFELVNSSLFSITHELKEHTKRLDSIERKQIGMLSILDESVHHTEFTTLTRRVELLEKKSVRK